MSRPAGSRWPGTDRTAPPTTRARLSKARRRTENAVRDSRWLELTGTRRASPLAPFPPARQPTGSWRAFPPPSPLPPVVGSLLLAPFPPARQPTGSWRAFPPPSSPPPVVGSSLLAPFPPARQPMGSWRAFPPPSPPPPVVGSWLLAPFPGATADGVMAASASVAATAGGEVVVARSVPAGATADGVMAGFSASVAATAGGEVAAWAASTGAAAIRPLGALAGASESPESVSQVARCESFRTDASLRSYTARVIRRSFSPPLARSTARWFKRPWTVDFCSPDRFSASDKPGSDRRAHALAS